MMMLRARRGGIMGTKAWSSLLKALAALCLISAVASHPVWAGHVNFTFGDRNLDDDFEPMDGHQVVGVAMLTQQEDWPFSIALGFYRSESDRESDTDFGPLFGPGAGSVVSEFNELSIGVAKVWDTIPHGYVFIGGGMTLMEARVETRISGLDTSADDRGIGPYANGGIFWRVGDALNLGFELRFARAVEVRLLGETFKADYTQFGWLVGWGWD
jgi:hypothetical protein